MKARKFLKLLKKCCREENCAIGICPLAYPHACKDGSIIPGCKMAFEDIEGWDIGDICKSMKKFEMYLKE